MDILFILAILLGLAAWAFKVGKREGSRGGFAAGRGRRL